MLAASCRLYAVFIFFMLKILQLKKKCVLSLPVALSCVVLFHNIWRFSRQQSSIFSSLTLLSSENILCLTRIVLNLLYGACIVGVFCDSLCARDCSSLWNLPALILAYTFQVIFEIRLMCISFSNVLVMGLNESLYLKIILIWNLKINLI